MKVRLNEAAAVELDEAIAYLNVQQPGLGLELLDEVVAARDVIAGAPERWPEIESGVRRYRVRRFRYGIVYRIRPDHVEVIAVMHLSRRPGYWHGR
jgi:hypothetical protein